MRGHRLQDQVVRLPVAAHQRGGIGVRRLDLVRRALHQAHLQPPARQHVEPRHLLGHAHRIGPVGDRRAQRQQPRAFGFTRNDRQRHRHRHRHARRRAVVLVHHDVEPDLVAQRELVEIAVQQAVRGRRIEVAGRQHHAQRAAREACLPRRVIRHLGEIPAAHRRAPQLVSVKRESRSAKPRGCSQCGKWPALEMTSIRAPRNLRAPGLAVGWADNAVLLAPQQQRGMSMRCSQRFRCGLCM